MLLSVSLLLMMSAGATALAASSTASKTSQPASAGTLTLSVKAKRSLARQHVTLRALRPATRRQSSYALPETSGKWNFTNATGTLHFKGVLAIAVAKHTVKLNSVTFTRPAKGNGKLTVKLAGHQMKLFTITGKAKITRAATSETITGLTAKLTNPGATRVDKALHSKAFKAGQSLGSFKVTVGTSPINAGGAAGGPGAPGAAGINGAAGRGAGLQFVPAFRSLLNSAGLSALPILPGTNGLPAPLGTTTIPGADGSLTLPLNGSTAGGSFNQGTLTGTIPLSGGLQLDNGALSVSLTNPQLTLGTGTEGSSLSFQVNGGPELKLFNIDTSQLEQSALPNGTIDLQGLLATLSSQGAASLNTLAGKNVFTTGQPVGGLSVILPAASPTP